jgi:hypothetical protein
LTVVVATVVAATVVVAIGAAREDVDRAVDMRVAGESVIG